LMCSPNVFGAAAFGHMTSGKRQFANLVLVINGCFEQVAIIKGTWQIWQLNIWQMVTWQLDN